MRNWERRDDFFDPAIVGAGISSAYALIHYISLLEKQWPSEPVKVLVFERSSENLHAEWFELGVLDQWEV